ncbi:MAG: trehalase family glycosidase [Bacteroidales bacterium]
MKTRHTILRSFLVLILALATQHSTGQYLSNLHAGRNDPVFCTYAAPVERSRYTIDQGYRFDFSALKMVSQQGGEWGLTFRKDGLCRSGTETYHKGPVITTSYADLCRYYFYPYRNLRVEVFFNVYSSGIAWQEVRILNESKNPEDLYFWSWLHFSKGNAEKPAVLENRKGSGCIHHIERDDWMKSHNIPYAEHLRDIFLSNVTPDSLLIMQQDPKALCNAPGISAKSRRRFRGIALGFNISLDPGASRTLRIARGLDKISIDPASLHDLTTNVLALDPSALVAKNEALYSGIPKLEFSNRDHEAVYWNAFNLMRQCMMPPEGACSHNYYVFSREPKWGWGYGGQVFHESLAMMAYAYMDPLSAMNSQRVYMERQWPDGYINYRTGPYLNEQIPRGGEYTSAAPWFNYQNMEIYRISGDIQFLAHAYKTGKAYYDYMVSNRDKDGDGLCEWGAHAMLESVRDARVATWDKVGWPSNFEAPDLNSMLVMEAQALSDMAFELGYKDEGKHWMQKATERKKLINKYLWDPVDGFYYHVDKKDNDFTFHKPSDLKIKEITGFLPLWAGIPDKGKADTLLMHLTDPSSFWRKFGIPSLSASHAYYNPIGYWNGPIWVQWQYLVFRGLLQYGYRKEAEALANKVIDNIIHHLETDHTFWELYSADDYQAGWNHTYIWTGIIARFLIDLDLTGDMNE